MGVTAAIGGQMLWASALHAEHVATTGPRYLVARLPAFRLERCGFRPDEVVALVAERRNATRIVACTPAAREAGLREEMTAAEARALVGGVVLEPLDEVGEGLDRVDLVVALEQVCDRVRLLSEDELLLEVSNCSGLYGGEQATLAKVRSFLEQLGHLCHLALSDHPEASAALARCRQGDTLVPVGASAQALAPLPVQALRPSPVLRQALATLGVRDLGTWAALDPASISGRFGAEGAALHQVARGQAGLPWIELPTPSTVGRLQLPVDHELEHVDALMAYLQPGLHRLRDALEARGEVVVVLETRLTLDRGSPERVTLRVGQPTRDPARLAELLRIRLEGLTLQAPVVGLSLYAPEVALERAQQEDLLVRREATEPLPALLARLTEALGDEAVYTAELTTSWRPEHTWRPRPVHQAPARTRAPVVRDPVACQEQGLWEAPRPRPTLLRTLGVPVRVEEDAAGLPAALRGVRGWEPVERLEGPERLEGDWWHADGGFARDYWVASVAGRTLWLFHERDSWFVQGWFD